MLSHPKRGSKYCGPLFFLMATVLWFTLFNPGLCQAGENYESGGYSGIISLPFIANEGQLPEAAAFYTLSSQGSVYITRAGEIVYSISRKEGEGSPSVVVREKIGDGNPDPPCGEEKINAAINYFSGKNPDNWRSGIAAYQKIIINNIYPGISMELHNRSGLVEKFFHIAPGGDVNQISLNLSGGDFEVGSSGTLIIKTPHGNLEMSTPHAYQYLDGQKQAVKVSYRILSDNCYGFSVTAYDPTRELIIDPVLISTFLGGSNNEAIYSIALDSSGSVYVTGNTDSVDFPVSNASSYQSGLDAFVARFNSDLSTLLSAAFIGGDDDETAKKILITENDSIIISGETKSSNFPVTANAYDRDLEGSRDAFICCLSSDLTALTASTYYGGSGEDSSISLVTGNNHDIYIGGTTGSSDLPMKASVTGAVYGYDTVYNNDGEVSDTYTDVFIASFSDNLENLKAATYFSYLGDKQADQGVALATDPSGDIYIAGNFRSNSLNSYAGVGKFNPDLSELKASSYFRPDELWSPSVWCNAMTIGPSGDLYIAWRINSESSWYERIRRFSSELSYQNEWITGGFSLPPEVFALGLANGNLYVAGSAAAADNCTTGYIVCMDPGLEQEGNTIYLGNQYKRTRILDLDFDGSGRVYAAGYTNSPDFPVNDFAYDNELNEGGSPEVPAYDGFIAVLDAQLQEAVSTDLSISQETEGGEYASGDTVPLRIAVRNNGPGEPAVGRVDTVINPADAVDNITVTTAGGDSYSIEANHVTLFMNNLSAGQQRQAVLNITTRDSFTGTLEMLSSVSLSGTTDSNADNNQAPSVNAAIGSGGQTGETECDVWADIQNTASGENQWLHAITFGNYGPTSAANVTVSNFLPAQLDFVSAQPEGYTYDPLTHSVSWSMTTLESGYQSGQSGDDYKVETKLKENQTPDNVMSSLIKVLTSTPDRNAENNEKQVSFGEQYNCTFYLRYDKETGRDNNDLIYRCFIYNTGGMPIKTNISFPVPQGLAYKSYLSMDLYQNHRGLASESGGTVSWTDTAQLQPDSSLYVELVFKVSSWNDNNDYKIEAAATLSVEGHPELKRVQTAVTSIVRPDRHVKSNEMNEIINRGQGKQTLPVEVTIINKSNWNLSPMDVKVSVNGGAPGKVKIAKIETEEQNTGANITGDTVCEWKVPYISPVSNGYLPNNGFSAFNVTKLYLEFGPVSEGEALSDIIINVETAYAPEYSEYEYELHEVNKDDNSRIIKIHLVEMAVQKEGRLAYDPSKGLVQQNFTTYYKYQNTNPMPPGIENYVLTENFSYLKAYKNFANLTYPDMTAEISTENGAKVTRQSTGPFYPGRKGEVLTVLSCPASEFPFGQDVQVDTRVRFRLAGADTWYENAFAHTYKLDMPAPAVSTPESGEMCHLSKGFAVGGYAIPGAQIRFYNALTKELIPASNTVADDQGAFLGSIPDNQHSTQNNRARLSFYCTQVVNGIESGPSAAVGLSEPSHCWCPQRSYWDGTIGGKKYSFKFRSNSNGKPSTTGWQIPGKFGFWNSALHLYVCCDNPREVKVIADGIEYQPSGHTGHYYTFNIKYAHDVIIVVDCEKGEESGKEKESGGVVLIDPDGYVYNVKQGLASVVPGAQVTCMAYDEANQSWMQWPAELYNKQVNPQTVGNDGYFAFFTPPGKYYLAVQNPDSYQAWRSRDIQVISEIVHQNVPYTPDPGSVAASVYERIYVSPLGLKREDDSDGSSLMVKGGTIVEWIATGGDSATPAQVLAWQADPVIHILSDIDPDGNIRGFDSGMLTPLTFYRYRFDAPGTYAYSYSADNPELKGTIIVSSASNNSDNSGGGGSDRTSKKLSITKTIHALTGGSLSLNGLYIEIPAGTLAEDLEFKIRQMEEQEHKKIIADNLLPRLSSAVYAVSSSGSLDDKQINIKFKLDDLVNQRNEPVTVCYHDGSGWVPLETTLIYATDGSTAAYVLTTTNKLSLMAVFNTAANFISLTIDDCEARINKENVQLDARPYIDSSSNRTMVPVRFISEALGASVKWIEDSRTVVINRGEHEIVMTPGLTTVRVDGNILKTDCAPIILPPGRTFLPLRFLSEILGFKVDYDDVQHRVYLASYLESVQN